MIEHVYRRAAASRAVSKTIVATDDLRIAAAVRQFGGEVRMTAATHQSGTDRVHEVARGEGWPKDAIVVNLQGDEPLMPPALVRETAQALEEDAGADISTVCHPLHDVADWLNPNVVKVALDRRGYALNFSRAPMPWKREPASNPDPAAHFPAGLAYRHVGLYGYRVGSLDQFSGLAPAELEQCEALEQLRALVHGFRIKVTVTDRPPPRGVDTEADLNAVTALLSSR
jgi:3-deoxy-manno-octulosonate cytidylyltransferase (CMP-KDO synthetase)